MLITIKAGYSDSTFILTSKDSRFIREWGTELCCNSAGVYKNLALVANWANNDIKEECLFEVE